MCKIGIRKGKCESLEIQKNNRPKPHKQLVGTLQGLFMHVGSKKGLKNHQGRAKSTDEIIFRTFSKGFTLVWPRPQAKQRQRWPNGQIKISKMGKMEETSCFMWEKRG